MAQWLVKESVLNAIIASERMQVTGGEPISRAALPGVSL
jgi:hypothetical protein